nr:M3 family metallopeptidase [Deltaproteobacteria bacterium]
PELRELEQALEPELAAHSDRTFQDPGLYARVRAVYDARESLTPEQQRLAWVYDNRFRQSGAELDEAARTRVAAINQELSGLYTTFSQNLLADEEGYVLYLTTEEELAGLPEGLKTGAAAAAAERGKQGQWAITNTRSSMEPFLTFSTRRDLREKVWRTYYGRGDNGDAHDNNAIITGILKLRAERAKLLGYATHAHLQLSDTMAKTPENAMALMLRVWPVATAQAKEEVKALQKVANAEGAKITIEPWDWRHYAEKVRRERYDLDQNAVKPYLQLEKLREGMFWAAGEMFGWKFQPVDVPVAHPDIRVWEVVDADGAHRGLWYFDPYARPGKQSGAWMNGYRSQERLASPVTTIVSNNSNFVKGAPGEAVLVSWDDAETLFHEFGHALHGLASEVTYPSLSGTSVSRDYVEFPSQLNEYWLSTPEILEKFAVHHETGEPMPQAMLERIEAASTFNQGFATTEYLASALIDMKLHLAGDAAIDPDAFEKAELAKLGMPPQIVMRHRTPQFGHVFSGDGYSAGYYSYLWADTLTADAAAAFVEGGGYYDQAVAQRYRDTVLKVGNTVDPAEAWRAFRGRDVSIEPWMKDKGFTKK